MILRHSARFVLRRRLPLLVAVLGVTAACQDVTGPVSEPPAEHNAILRWNEVALAAVRDSRMGPPMVARALAIAHTSMYDAWAAYDGVAVGTHWEGSLRRPSAERTAASKQEAVSYAAHRALTDLFPGQVTSFDVLLRELGYNPANASTDLGTPAGVGNAAAAAVLRFRHGDGSNQLGDLHAGAYSDYTGYKPVNTPDEVRDPNRWQPLHLPDASGKMYTQDCLAPHWGSVVPFALRSGSQLRPPPPAPYGSEAYRRQVEEVIRFSASLTDREKAIAEYWADGPNSELPPGHWNLMAQFVSERDHHTLDEDVKLFFALNNALMDAGIAAWEAKRFYDYVRPVTAIRYLMKGETIQAWAGPGRGTQPIAGETWQPYQVLTFVTPPFAEYVSGHSTFSAAAAEVLKRFTGSDHFGASITLPAGSSRVEPGIAPARDVTLRWSTFSEAADEAGISRLYGGIHFRDGDEQGRKMGRAVGTLAWSRAQGYFSGTAR